MHEKFYYVYILLNKSNTTSYIGVTNDLLRRIEEHKNKSVRGFTARYNLTKLVYYEIFNAPYEAITRERQLKRWSRTKKAQLIRSMNPILEDLTSRLF